MSPWERHCFKDGSYDRYQSSTVIAAWPPAIAPKFKALGKAQEFPPGKPKVPPYSCTYPGRMKAELALTDLIPSLSTEVPNLPPAYMACMCVPPSWLVATPWLVPIVLRPLVKVRGSSPKEGILPYSLYRPRRDGRLSITWPVECRFMNHYTVLQKYSYIELKQNLLRSITLDIITRLLDNASFACVHPVGRFSKDFSEVRGLRSRGFQLQVKRWQQYCMRNYEKKCKSSCTSHQW